MRIRAATLIAISSLVFAQAVLAAGRDRLSYTGIEASFGRAASENSDLIAHLIDIHASLDLGGPVPVFVSASRTQSETDLAEIWSPPSSVKATLSRFDLGFHFGSDSTANFVSSISVVETRAEFLGNLAFIQGKSESGWAARGAVRALGRSWLELGAFIEMMIISDDATPTAGAEAILYADRHLGVGIGYEASEGTQAVSVRVRLVH